MSENALGKDSGPQARLFQKAQLSRCVERECPGSLFAGATFPVPLRQSTFRTRASASSMQAVIIPMYLRLNMAALFFSLHAATIASGPGILLINLFSTVLASNNWGPGPRTKSESLHASIW